MGRGLTAHRERFRLQRTLVVSQVALSLVLLFGALLFIRTLSNLASVNLGFHPENILIVDVDVPGHPLEQRPVVIEELRQRLRAIPGVLSVAHTSIVPLSGSAANNMVWMEGTPRENNHLAQMSSVSPGYFATVGTQLKDGRDFDERDTPSSPKVAIVTETFVRKIAGGVNPIGRRFIEPGDTTLPDQPYEIIGIVEDMKYGSVRDENEPIAYMAASQVERPTFFPAFLLRVAGPSAPVFDWVRTAAPEVHPDLSLDFAVLASNIHQTLQRERLVAMLATAFAGLAALLVTLGLYGVLSYMVTRRNNEIGIRIALGARPGTVAGMFAREAGMLVVLGVAIGLALATATGRLASG
ncbi:MAG: ABC transporter permease, partial [Vicinamibacterales bacterium]